MPGVISKHRKIFSLLLLFVLLFWIITLQVKNGRFPFMEKPVLAVSGFFERILIWPFSAIVSAGNKYVFLVGTQRENRQLKEENDRLRLESELGRGTTFRVSLPEKRTTGEPSVSTVGLAPRSVDLSLADAPDR